jgi:hypothetical protein
MHYVWMVVAYCSPLPLPSAFQDGIPARACQQQTRHPASCELGTQTMATSPISCTGEGPKSLSSSNLARGEVQGSVTLICASSPIVEVVSAGDERYGACQLMDCLLGACTPCQPFRRMLKQTADLSPPLRTAFRKARACAYPYIRYSLMRYTRLGNETNNLT